MGRAVAISQVAVAVFARIPADVVELNVGYAPRVLGQHLAEQVDARARQAGIGYYPALDYFRQPAEAGTGVDPALLSLTEEVAGYCVDLAKREFRRRLSRVFSSIRITHAHCDAFNLPRIRPRQSGALEQLARHYQPNGVRMELQLSSIERRPVDDALAMAQLKIRRWACQPFDTLEVMSGRVLR